jgi:putative flavoprotein involved in K+ transport
VTEMPVAAERVETLILGGGQAGLSAGYHLAKRGLPFLIIDADDRIGDHWRERWDSLRLYSPARSDALPGMPFPASAYSYPSGNQMADYLESYAARFELPVLSGTRVDGLRAADGEQVGYVVSAGGRRFEAAQVVVATGAFQTPRVPDVSKRLDPGIRQLHSHEYRNPGQLQEGPVLVVGLSHSGADIAFETARTHRTLLSGKAHGQLPFAVIDTWRARIVWPLSAFVFSHVVTIRTPIGRKMAVEVRKGGGPLLRVRLPDLDRVGVERHDAKVVGARDGKPMLADGQVLDVANVIWCTGFGRDYSWIDLPVVDDDGWPLQERGVVHSAPGLYFLGIPFTYAFTSMLVAGAGRDAAFVADRIAARAKETRGARSIEETPALAS